MKKVLVYCDIHWSLGRVNRNIEAYLNDEYVFTYYDWAKYPPIFIICKMLEYDICLTNLCTITHFTLQNIQKELLKKFIFVSHGFVEFDKLKSYEYPVEPIYSVTSPCIFNFFPENMRNNVMCSLNGVELKDFNYIEKSGNISNVGWAGKSNKWNKKREEWSIEIANKTNLLLHRASNLSYDEIKEWYNGIDVLLINTGPEIWTETGPLPAFEAIASGTLVIGTKVGNFAEIPGPKYETIDQAVEIINELKQNPTKVKEISAEQYEYVKNNLSYEKISKQWRVMFAASLNNKIKFE